MVAPGAGLLLASLSHVEGWSTGWKGVAREGRMGRQDWQKDTF